MGTVAPSAPALTDTDVLEQFFAGHITAGQLTQRLQERRQPARGPIATGLDTPTAGMPALQRPARHAGARRVVSLGVLGTIVAAGGAVAAMVIGSGAQPVSAHLRPSADRSVISQRHRGHALKRAAGPVRPAAPGSAAPVRSSAPASSTSTPAGTGTTTDSTGH